MRREQDVGRILGLCIDLEVARRKLGNGSDLELVRPRHHESIEGGAIGGGGDEGGHVAFLFGHRV